MDVKINNAGYIVNVDSLTQRKSSTDRKVRVMRYNQDEIDYRLLGYANRYASDVLSLFNSYRGSVNHDG